MLSFAWDAWTSFSKHVWSLGHINISFIFYLRIKAQRWHNDNRNMFQACTTQTNILSYIYTCTDFISCLLMTWWCKQPRNQWWYWTIHRGNVVLNVYFYTQFEIIPWPKCDLCPSIHMQRVLKCKLPMYYSIYEWIVSNRCGIEFNSVMSQSSWIFLVPLMIFYFIATQFTCASKFLNS